MTCEGSGRVRRTTDTVNGYSTIIASSSRIIECPTCGGNRTTVISKKIVLSLGTRRRALKVLVLAKCQLLNTSSYWISPQHEEITIRTVRYLPEASIGIAK